ncbi:MAG: hypothetical protein CMN29_31910 [Sandaracinus sp.]|nr:hypothetical protein [Sandaracinus sp.]
MMLFGVGLGLGWLVGNPELGERFSDLYQVAEAVLSEDAPSWPPSARATARPDAGPPADAGPPGDAAPAEDQPPRPLLPTDLPDRPGYRARAGEHEGLVYLEAVLGDASFDDPLPLVVLLHGRGGSADLPGGPFLDLSHPVRVIAPQAPDPLGDGWQWLPVRVGSGLVDRLSATLFDTASRLARFLRSLDLPMDGRPIVTGFSQGGLLTLSLALHHDDVVGAALPLAAWLPPPLEPTYRRDDLYFPRIRSLHGTADTIIPPEPTVELFARLQDLGFDVDLATFEGVEHRMSPEMDALFHEWLDEAVCAAVGDEEGLFAAQVRAAELQGLAPPARDAGPPRLPDGALLPLPDGALPDGALLDGALPDGAAPDAGAR